ncbi:MAG: hypothetical protein J5684_01620, partial [Eubacterium sp.]|nr:hypothetical protein [Eubacterium sp.]
YGFQNVTKNIRMLSRLNRDKMPFDNPEDFWGAESLNFICYRYNLFNDNDSEYITMDFIVPEGDNDWFLFNCLSYDDMAETVEQDNDLSDLPQDELDDILFEDYGSATDAE